MALGKALARAPGPLLFAFTQGPFLPDHAQSHDLARAQGPILCFFAVGFLYDRVQGSFLLISFME